MFLFRAGEMFQFAPDYDLKVSEHCCTKLKKEVAHKYEEDSGRNIAITGVRRAEGGARAEKSSCLAFDPKGKAIQFKPLNPCDDSFIEWYIETRNIELCKLYYPPYNLVRTGCKGCPFNIHIQEELDMLERYFPAERKQCELIFGKVYNDYRKHNYRLKEKL